MSFNAVCVVLFSWLFGPKCDRENNVRYVLKYVRKKDVWVADGSSKELNQERRVCVPCETICTLNYTIINPNHSVFLFMKLNNLFSCLKPKPPAAWRDQSHCCITCLAEVSVCQMDVFLHNFSPWNPLGLSCDCWGSRAEKLMNCLHKVFCQGCLSPSGCLGIVHWSGTFISWMGFGKEREREREQALCRVCCPKKCWQNTLQRCGQATNWCVRVVWVDRIISRPQGGSVLYVSVNNGKTYLRKITAWWAACTKWS